MSEFLNLYKLLFSSEDSPASRIARDKCGTLIPKIVSPDEVKYLSKPFSTEEIIRAINSLHNDKAQGPDGLTIEFYKANIAWIVDDLLEVYNEATRTRSLGIDINRGLIKLIPKEGDKALIKNCRPITLLNVSYKILAKMLALRLENILPKFICSTQTGIIKGRYILENLITSWEAMEWARILDQKVAMFLLDFEKAYDGIEWGFISTMLQAFGFPKIFCQFVQILLRDAHAQVEINGPIS